MADEPKRRKFHIIEIIILVLLALIADVVQIILDFFVVGVVLNTVIDVIFLIILGLWLFFRNLTNTRVIQLTLAAAVGEAIPVVNALPLWTAEVIYLIYLINSGKVKTYSKKELMHGGARELAMESATSIGTSKVPGARGVAGAVEGKVEKKAVSAGVRGAVRGAEEVAVTKASQAGIRSASERALENTGDKIAQEAGKSASQRVATASAAGTVQEAVPTKSLKNVTRRRIGEEIVREEESADEKSDFERFDDGPFSWARRHESLREQYPDESDETIRGMIEEEKVLEKRETRRTRNRISDQT